MITMIFAFMMVMVFGKLGIMAFKFTWNIVKVFTYLLFLPLIVLFIAAAGLVQIAIPVLAIIGIVALVKNYKAA